MTLVPIYICLILLGAAIIINGILTVKIKKRNSILTSFNENKRIHLGTLDQLLDKMPFITKTEAAMDEKLKAVQSNLTGRKLTKYRLLGLLAAILGAVYLQNYLAVIPLFLLLWNFPVSFFEVRINKKLRAFDNQFLEALKMLISEVTTIRSARKAISNITPQLQSPLKEEFERLDRKLNSGGTVEEAFVSFAERTNNRWTLVFSQLMITYSRIGGDLAPHLMSITKRINSEKVQDEQNKTELSSMRAMNVFMNALVPVVYVASRFLNPEDSALYTETQTGRTIIFVILCACVFSIWLGKKITKA